MTADRDQADERHPHPHGRAAQRVAGLEQAGVLYEDDGRAPADPQSGRDRERLALARDREQPDRRLGAQQVQQRLRSVVGDAQDVGYSLRS
jgi:hypothetical protein